MSERHTRFTRSSSFQSDTKEPSVIPVGKEKFKSIQLEKFTVIAISLKGETNHSLEIYFLQNFRSSTSRVSLPPKQHLKIAKLRYYVLNITIIYMHLLCIEYPIWTSTQTRDPQNYTINNLPKNNQIVME